MKLFLCTPRRHMGSECIAPLNLNFGTRWWWDVNFKPWPLYFQAKRTQYPTQTRLGGPQSQSRWFEEWQSADEWWTTFFYNTQTVNSVVCHICAVINQTLIQTFRLPFLPFPDSELSPSSISPLRGLNMLSSESPSIPSQFSALWIFIRSRMSSSSVLPMFPPLPFSGPKTVWLYSGSFTTG